MSRILNQIPKRISIANYLDTLDRLGYKCSNRIVEIFRCDRNATVKLLLDIVSIEGRDQFRLSYVLKDLEGYCAYFPLKQATLVDFESGFTPLDFDGGYIGEDLAELEERLYNWLKENNYG